METFYITTAIDYVNGAPHIGHAYEKIMTDAIARHFKLRGKEVFFLTGTDEHGIKIQQSAEKNAMTPKEFTDMNAAKFKAAWEKLDVLYDRFIRTTEEQHYAVVKSIFKTLVEKDDIYKAKYTGLYCNGCEKFITERELEDGNCPIHQAPPVEVEEENYFFRISRYKDRLIAYIKENPTFIMPEFRKNEILNQLDTLEDISVSRSTESVQWGIPVPGDEDQTIYVWIDALSNYITGIGYLSDENTFKKYWPANCQVIGKDIIKFHAIFWTCMLMALDLPLPKTLAVHGFITVDESKMSKSLDNIVNPLELTDKFDLENSDALRYYLLSNAYLGKDANFSELEFINKVDADLANNLGNLLNRTLSMLVKYTGGQMPKPSQTSELASMCEEARQKVLEEFDQYQLGSAAEAVIRLVDAANKYVNDQTPWSKAKNEDTKEEALTVLYDVLETLRWTSYLIEPFTPNLAQKIREQLHLDSSCCVESLDELAWGGLSENIVIEKANIKPIFLRIGSELAGDKKKK